MKFPRYFRMKGHQTLKYVIKIHNRTDNGTWLTSTPVTASFNLNMCLKLNKSLEEIFESEIVLMDE